MVAVLSVERKSALQRLAGRQVTLIYSSDCSRCLEITQLNTKGAKIYRRPRRLFATIRAA